MNSHEALTQEPERTLSQHRVTPEELTRALAAIEARQQKAARLQEAEREAEQAYLSVTIPVEDAVRELNLETTPEEIWAEVQEQRAADSRVETAPKPGEEENNTLPFLVSESGIRAFRPAERYQTLDKAANYCGWACLDPSRICCCILAAFPFPSSGNTGRSHRSGNILAI